MSNLIETYRARVTSGALRRDPMQERAAERLQALTDALKGYRPGKRGWFSKAPVPPRGLYIWGDVGRGKSMLMDLFFAGTSFAPKRRIHFNAFMGEAHARIFEERKKPATRDPIPAVAQWIASQAMLLCFDEFQVTDVADAMILGRLFEQLFALGVVVVATSNTTPRRLYEGGLNRELFLPFIAMIEQRLDIVELNGAADYRRLGHAGLDLYITPLGPEADARMDAAFTRLTGNAPCAATSLRVLGRDVKVPCAAEGVARFGFADLCATALAANDYLAVAQAFHTVLIDHIPFLGPENRNEARRFILLIDTLYDQGVRLICSAAAPPDGLYPSGDGAEAFRRTASRLIEMQSEDYLSHFMARAEAAQ